MAFLLFLLFIISLSNSKELTLFNYNVWNYMFSWRTRFIRIAEMIEENSVDIITLEEIYSNENDEKNNNNNNNDNQLQYLLSLLPSTYKYYNFSTNMDISNGDYNKNEIFEGLAIISKYPIFNIKKYFFKERSNNPDTGDMNPRMVLKTTICINKNNNYLIDIYLTHLTYDKILQCKHIAELLYLINNNNNNNNIKHILITGDLNVYKDYKYPMDLLKNGKTKNKQCNKYSINIGIKFIDVFYSMQPKENKILTFSNMPYPGMISRPDRLYLGNINNNNNNNNNLLKIKSINIIGDGKYYKMHYYYNILLDRFWVILNGKNCKIDCGPNGYCKCGVCVKNPNGIIDEMKDCNFYNNCNYCINHLYLLLKLILINIILHFILYYSCINGLYIAPRLKYFNSNLSIPIIILFITSFIIISFIIISYFIINIQQILINMLPEELFPSDHRGLLTTFEYNQLT